MTDTTTPPDFTEQVCRCGHPLHYYKCRIGDCDCPAQADKAVATDTAANGFTEQARQLVDECCSVGGLLYPDDVTRLTDRVASFASEAATAALEQAARWQPIETAPKDKTVVLVALIKDGKVWRVNEASFNGLGWYDIGGKSCHWRTHWTPLPPIAAIGDDREQW